MKQSMSEKLEDHIDEPIKKCVAGMALLGYNPIMSCCGFNYKGEKVPKKHLKKTYMYLKPAQPFDTAFYNIMIDSQWTLKGLGKYCFDFFANTWDANHPWNEEGCPHFYEVFAIAINSLEKAIERVPKDFFAENVLLKDGNEDYKKNIKHWQYEPAEPWKITYEEFIKM